MICKLVTKEKMRLIWMINFGGIMLYICVIVSLNYIVITAYFVSNLEAKTNNGLGFLTNSETDKTIF